MPQVLDEPGIMSLAYGGVQLQLLSYKVKEEPQVTDGIGAVNVKVTLTCECLLTSGTPASFGTELEAARTALAASGADAIVTGLGGVTEFDLLAATCRDNGPFVTYDDEAGDTPLSRKFNLSIEGGTPPKPSGGGGGGAAPANSYKVETQTRPDGLMKVTWTGTINGTNTPAFYLASILPQFQKSYANGWVIESQYDNSTDGLLSKLDYTLTATQNVGILPATPAGGSMAVSGEATQKIDRDQDHRKTTTFEFDLLCVGDAIAILTQIRTQASDGGNKIILRESYSLTTIRENRLHASFTILESADRPPLMNWTETISLKAGGQVWEEKTYIGAAPILVQRPAVFPRVTQTGQAIAAGQFKRPVPRYVQWYASEPSVTLTDSNDVEKQTTWNYEMFPAAAGAPDPTFNVLTVSPKFMARAAQDNNYFS